LFFPYLFYFFGTKTFKDFNMPGKVHICMTTFNRLDFTKLTIESLKKSEGYPFILTVVDNNSKDETRYYLKNLWKEGFINNLILLDENLGVAKAANLGWKLEDTDYYIKFDNDVTFENPNWLAPMVEIIDNVPEIGILAYKFEQQNFPLKTFGNYTIQHKVNGAIGGACVLIPRRTHEKLGYWREDYQKYGEEDADFSFRAYYDGFVLGYMKDSLGKHLPENFGYEAEVEQKVQNYRAWKDVCNSSNKRFYHENVMMYYRDSSTRYIDSSMNVADYQDKIFRG
jgi:glycosyltransferase involved in cell wall biosynthesis